MKQKNLLLCLCSIIHITSSLQASLFNTQEGVVWQRTTFSPPTNQYPAPVMYLGANKQAGATDEQKELALARARVAINVLGAASVAIDPLAPAEDVIVNGAAPAVSPFNNKTVTNLTLQPSTSLASPVLTLASDKNVYFVASPSDGTVVLKNSVAINDADGTGKPTNEIKALAANTDTIFAAVSANGQTWQADAGAARGIAVLKADKTGNKLQVYDATDFSKTAADNQAAEASSLAADKLFAFVDSGAGSPINFAKLGAPVTMFFNPHLERLYVGLDSVARNVNTDEGGVLGVFMGRLNTVTVSDEPITSLKLQPILSSLEKDLFYDAGSKNVADRVIGFYADGVNADGGDKAFAATVSQINAMRTSTGKDYLIINSLVTNNDDKTQRGIFALPLLGTEDWAGSAIDAEKIGTVSKVVNGIATFDVPPSAFDQMPLATDPAVLVQDTDPAKISQIFVSGDALYWSRDDANDDIDQGIFSSRAMFDHTGAVRAWTPAQRVMGSLEKVSGFALDTKYQPGAFYALTTKTFTENDPNTIRVTQWGKSDDVTKDDVNNTVNNLSSVLARLFPVENGGLVALQSFDEKTPGFVQDKFAMMVAVGHDKIALIQTVYNNSGQFGLVTKFIDDATSPNQNVFVFDAESIPALKEIMPLMGVEVSRMTTANFGWLFVYGLHGVRVLSLPTGNGWTDLNGLSKANNASFPGGSDWAFRSFNTTNNLTDIVKLVAANGRMYVVTLNKLFFFDMNIIAKFKGPGATVLGELAVDGPEAFTSALLADLVVFSPTNDVLRNRGVIATNHGIFASDLSTDATQMVLVQKLADLALELQSVQDVRSEAPKTANLYALATDFSDEDTLYRFDVPDATVTNIADMVKVIAKPSDDGLFASLHDTRQSFMTDGTFVYSTLPKNYGSKDYFHIDVPAESSSFDMTPVLNLDTQINTYISGVLREGASGTIMIPGDWGVRVNQ